MNKPVPDLRPDADDLGLAADGQIWPPETEAAITRLLADPAYKADVMAGLASVERGHGYTTEQALAELARRRAAR